MALFGVQTILPSAPWPFIDVMLIAVPVAALLKLQFERYVEKRRKIVQEREHENNKNNGKGNPEAIE